jgi:heat shock protein HslJ
MRITLSFVVTLLVCGVGCSSESNPWCKQAPLPVENYRWQLQGIEGDPTHPATADAQAPFFQLDSTDKHVTGDTGLNQFNGSYEMSGRALKFGPAAMTRQAGPEPLMRQEAAFSTVLTSTAAWRPFGDNAIDLLDAGGFPLARFTRGSGAEMK